MSAPQAIDSEALAKAFEFTDVESSRDFTPWIEALRHVADIYRLPMSEQSAALAAAWSTNEPVETVVAELARSAGLVCHFQAPKLAMVSRWQLPLIVQLRSGILGIITSIGSDSIASILFCQNGGLETPTRIEDIFEDVERVALVRPIRSVPDDRVDNYIKPVEKNWLTATVLPDFKPYIHVMIASLITNLLGLVTTLFSMQIYDRVVPAASVPTLWVLFTGVIIALSIDFLMRRARTDLVDILGKKADIRLSDVVLGRALRVRNRFRPTSTGTFISQIRDLEQVRDLFTSTTVTAIADIPFFLMYLVFFWIIGGNLIYIPLFAVMLIIVPGILVAKYIGTHAQEAMREASLRNALLVESIQGLEDIKGLQAEERFQQQWTYLTRVTSDAQVRLRKITSTLNAWTQTVQTAVFAVIILFGAQMVIAGDLTTGALVGASILGSRMMVPVASIAQLITKAQHARIAMKSLNQIMEMPIDHPPHEFKIHAPTIQGKFEISNAEFKYGGSESPTALAISALKIEPGERVALLGRTGSGKSTLLQAFSGMLEADKGYIFLDDLALPQIDPADVRRDIAYLSQNSRLFHGTLRENFVMGAPSISQRDIFAALDIVGASDFVRKLPKGLDYQVQEGGFGLSGGQKQSILLARLIVRNPKIVLLDEPSASMDEATERHFATRITQWAQGRTVVVATHRMRMLDLVDRIIIIENGLITLDQPKQTALEMMRAGTVQPPQSRSDGEV